MNLKDEKQWMEQAEYDMHAADKMFEAGVYPYTIFMCHLSIEKALKAVYTAKLKEEPPKMHNLLKLGALIELKLPDNIFEIITSLNNASVSARYPENIKSVLKNYGKDRTKPILEDSRRALEWLGKQSETTQASQSAPRRAMDSRFRGNDGPMVAETVQHGFEGTGSASFPRKRESIARRGARKSELTIQSEIKEIIDYFAQQLEQNGVSVDKIVLFGSQIKGNVHKDSDIDIIIVSKSFRNKDIIERAKMISRAHIDTFQKYPEAMDIVMETPEEYNPDFGMIVYAA